MPYYRIHHGRVSEDEFLRSACTWFWADRGNGMEEVEVPGVYSAVRSLRDLRTYIHEMQASDDKDVVAVFEGDEPATVRVDADGSGQAEWDVRSLIQEPQWGEVWVRPTQLITWMTISEALEAAEKEEE